MKIITIQYTHHTVDSVTWQRALINKDGDRIVDVDVEADNDVNVDANNDITSGSAQTKSLLQSTRTTYLPII